MSVMKPELYALNREKGVWKEVNYPLNNINNSFSLFWFRFPEMASRTWRRL